MALNRNPPAPERPRYRHDERLGFASLYLDDLDALLRHLRGQCERVTLYAGRATADHAEDLLSATPREWETVWIETSQPDLHIALQPNMARLVSFEASESARDIVSTVSTILRDHSSPAWIAMSVANGSVVLVATFIGLAFIVPTSFASTPELWNIILTVAIGVALIVAAAIFTGIRLVRVIRNGGVWLRKTTRTAATRGKVPIAVAIISAVGAAVAGALATVAAQAWWPLP